jgi:VanZ family protein
MAGEDPPLRWRPLWTILGGCLVLLIVWFSLVPRPPEVGPQMSDKVHHLLAYFTLMFWFGQLHARRLSVLLGCLGLGLALEWLQGLGGYRTASGLDMLANTAGALLAWAAVGRLPNALLRLESLWPLSLRP